MSRRWWRVWLASVSLALVLGACGNDAPAPEGTITAADIQEDGGAGAGSFTMVVGDQSWSFDSIRCAFGEEEIGQEGAEFVLSAIEDGLQAYVSIDAFGTSASIDDIEDPENPSVSYAAFGDTLAVDIAGKNLSGIGDFLDATTESPSLIEGTFAGTCP